MTQLKFTLVIEILYVSEHTLSMLKSRFVSMLIHCEWRAFCARKHAPLCIKWSDVRSAISCKAFCVCTQWLGLQKGECM